MTETENARVEVLVRVELGFRSRDVEMIFHVVCALGFVIPPRLLVVFRLSGYIAVVVVSFQSINCLVYLISFRFISFRFSFRFDFEFASFWPLGRICPAHVAKHGIGTVQLEATPHTSLSHRKALPGRMNESPKDSLVDADIDQVFLGWQNNPLLNFQLALFLLEHLVGDCMVFRPVLVVTDHGRPAPLLDGILPAPGGSRPKGLPQHNFSGRVYLVFLS
jgi:hypothetical protein